MRLLPLAAARPAGRARRPASAAFSIKAFHTPRGNIPAWHGRPATGKDLALRCDVRATPGRRRSRRSRASRATTARARPDEARQGPVRVRLRRDRSDEEAASTASCGSSGRSRAACASPACAAATPRTTAGSSRRRATSASRAVEAAPAGRATQVNGATAARRRRRHARVPTWQRGASVRMPVNSRKRGGDRWTPQVAGDDLSPPPRRGKSQPCRRRDVSTLVRR